MRKGDRRRVKIKLDDAYDSLAGVRGAKVERISWWRDWVGSKELLTIVYRVRRDDIHTAFSEVRLDLFVDGKHTVGTIIEGEYGS